MAKDDKEERDRRARQKELMRSATAELDKSGLTERQKHFCLLYVQSHNATQAYCSAYGCTRKAAGASGFRLLKKAEVKKEVRRLRKLMADAYEVDDGEMIRFLLKVVGTDLGDFMTFKTVTQKNEDEEEGEAVNAVMLKDSETLDTSVLKSVKQSSRGVVNIETYDKLAAWKMLDRIFGFTAERQAKEGSGQLNFAEAIVKARHRAETAAEDEEWGIRPIIVDDIQDEPPKDWKEGLERAGVNVADMTEEELAELQKIVAKHNG